jgi:nitrous oxidase accessory protein NosD
MVIGGLVHRIRELQRADVKDEFTRLRNVSQGVFLSVAIRLGPMAMQNISGLPSVRNDENHNGIEFWASSPRTVPN